MVSTSIPPHQPLLEKKIQSGIALIVNESAKLPFTSCGGLWLRDEEEEAISTSRMGRNRWQHFYLSTGGYS